MAPRLLDAASHRLGPGDWDCRELERLAGRAGVLEPQRGERRAPQKVEQETLQR